MPNKSKTPKQVRFLFSEVTPLDRDELAELKREVKSGKVKVRKQRKGK